MQAGGRILLPALSIGFEVYGIIMRLKIKIPFYGVCAFSLCVLYLLSNAYGMNVRVGNGRIFVNAEEKTLVSILESVSQKTGIIIKSNGTLSEKISVSIENVKVEDALKKLLYNRNYIFFYASDGKKQIKLAEVEIFDKKLNTLNALSISQEPEKKELTANIEQSQIDETMKRVKTHWFYQQLKDRKKIAKEIIIGSPDDPLLNDGALIISISRDSIFDKIGLETGDIIQNINGSKVYSKKDLILALSKKQSNGGDIRIERFNPDKEITYPIYIELNP